MSEPESAGEAVSNSGSARPRANELSKQVRGSTLLLVGRCAAILVNLGTQVLVVRALIRADYGALAYAISIVELAALTSVFALDKTISRYGAIYLEQGDAAGFRGAVRLVMAGPIVLSGCILLVIAGCRQDIAEALNLDAAALHLLLALCLLIPCYAAGSICLSIGTVLRGAKAVLYRKQIFAPLVRLVSVVAAVAISGDVLSVAYAYLAAGFAGVLIDGWLLHKWLSQDEVLGQQADRSVRYEPRKVFGYAAPLFLADLGYAARGTLLVVMLGCLASHADTAAYRAILPVVRLNELVAFNFGLLFTPLASRLLARNHTAELQQLFWRTSAWISVLSFPVFAACQILSREVTVLMFGTAYADAAVLLRVLACGYFLQATIGFNGRMIKVCGRVRLFATIDLVVSVMTVALAWILIPRFGARGAALAVTAAIAVHIGLKLLACRSGAMTGIPSRDSLMAQVTMSVCAAAVLLIGSYFEFGWVLGTLVACSFSVLVGAVYFRILEVQQMFPELDRWSKRVAGAIGISAAR